MPTSTDILQTLFGGWTQHDRFFQLTTSLGANALVAESMEGWEAVDHGGFRLQITALGQDQKLPIARLIGAPVLLEWLTEAGGDTRRPFHGHVAAAELIGYNGGLARFRLVLEPWLAMLRQRQDSYAYQDASVVDISEQIFGYYARGAVVPAWRWELADRAKYLKRSLTIQEGESDFDFLARLWAEEGIFYWFEHAGDADSSSLGSHTLVLADSNHYFLPGEPEVIQFHQTGEGEPGGFVEHFMMARRWRIGQVTRASWNHRSLSVNAAGASVNGVVVPGQDRDVAGPYAFQTDAVGSQRSRQQLDAQRVEAAQSQGEGTWRLMRPGYRFALEQHPTLSSSDAFVCLRVRHSARANVDADVRSVVEQQLGRIPQMLDAADGASGPAAILNAALGPDTHNSGPLEDGQQVYSNRFLVLPAEQTYRPLVNGHGARPHAAAIAQGGQSAIVVGDGGPIHTERDHRFRVQHHWQRGENSASRENHPFQANAPADQGAGTWTRMLTPVGGDNWGGVSVPRVGQEVWLERLEGQPDRPVAVGALYNGQGNADASYNAQAGGPSTSTANAGAWFAGNDHAAVLTGIKTQDMSLSQSGTGGYRQFQFDDTPGQSKAQLYTTDRNSGLTLGHVKQAQDNRRQADRGYGAELATEGSGAVRGGAGMLVTTADGDSQMDAEASMEDLAKSQKLVQGLVEVAQQQGAGSASEPPPDKLPAVVSLKQSHDALSAKRTGSQADQAVGGGGGSAAGWSAPLLATHGAAGLAAVSAKSHVWVSGKNTVFSAGQDIDVTTKGKASVVAKNGIALYAHGSPADGRPVSGQGIALHAAKGAVSVQAQDQGQFIAQAQKAVTLASTQAGVTVQGTQRVLLNAAGAYLKMEGGNIELGAPGKVELRGAQRELTGPQSANTNAKLVQSAAKDCPQTMDDMVASSAAYAEV